MATDLNLSTAALTLTDMLPAAGDAGQSSWAQNVAENTGVAVYLPRMVMAQQSEVSDGTEYHRAYMVTGTYNICTAAYINTNAGGVTIKLNGTPVWTFPSGTGWVGSVYSPFAYTQSGTLFADIDLCAGTATRFNTASMFVQYIGS